MKELCFSESELVRKYEEVKTLVKTSDRAIKNKNGEKCLET